MTPRQSKSYHSPLERSRASNPRLHRVNAASTHKFLEIYGTDERLLSRHKTTEDVSNALLSEVHSDIDAASFGAFGLRMMRQKLLTEVSERRL